jgi:hypothetical protein
MNQQRLRLLASVVITDIGMLVGGSLENHVGYGLIAALLANTFYILANERT